jgi:hypothetical protein
VTLVVLVFFAVTLLLLLLPFVPGLRELRAQRDAEPLPVSAEAAVDIRHFAHGFRAFLERDLGDSLARVRTTGMRRSGWIEGQGQYSVMAAGEPVDLFADEQTRRLIDRIVAGVADVEIPAGLRCLREIYAGGTLRAGAATEVRAVLADEDIVLERRARSVRWVHAGRDLKVAADSVLQGRASAGRSIALGAGCRFERLHAPVIRFGGDAPLPRAGDVVGAAPADVPLIDWEPAGLGAHHELAAGRLLVEGDLDIPARARVRCDLVVWGRLTIGAGARLEGSAKGHRAMRLARDARVDGSIVGRDDVTLEDGVVVDGPVIAEERLTIGARCTIGTAAEPSTVRAGAITVRAGSVIHGTAWASGQGLVRA